MCGLNNGWSALGMAQAGLRQDQIVNQGALIAEQAILRSIYGARLAGFDPLGRVILWGPTRIPKISPKPKPKGD